MNFKALVPSSVLAISLILPGAAQAQTITPQNTINAPGQMMRGQRLRGEGGSARNIRFELRHLEKAIDALQRDQRDYGGHREAAIDLLGRARAELNAALQYDATHPGR